ncbi:MAG TPA: hypothetical protein VJW23_09110, partial [Propionibacteriaceae bacterium]|nr:hypothetical protein [Propionibacteriaceae bacterium]
PPLEVVMDDILTVMDDAGIEFFAGIVSESLKAPARVWQSAFDGLLAFDDADQLERITVPTLIL